MWSKRLLRAGALALILAMLLALPGVCAGERAEAGAPILRLRSGQSKHEAFLHGYEDGSFRPNGFITRAEEAQMLYNLLSEKPADRAALADVFKGDWYYDALGLLAAAGVVQPDEHGCVQPNAQLTRAQFVMMLVSLFPDLGEAECSYTDLNPAAPWYSAVAKASAAGWVNGYEDGSFRAGERITRAEAATIINRALGRCADRERLDRELVIPLYTDLSREHWAYYEIMEATVGHRADMSVGVELWAEVDEGCLRYPPGKVFVGLDVYYADEEGVILRDQTVNGLYYGPDGRYTSLSEEADGYVLAILGEIVTPEMSRLEMLRAAFDYVRDSYSYLRRNDGYETGATGWEVKEGLTLLSTGRGNCYCYAGAFCLLARQLGYDAKAIAGTTNWNPRPHAWVEIEFDGVPYIFDTELEWQFRVKQGVDDYDFFMMSYDETPWPYGK